MEGILEQSNKVKKLLFQTIIFLLITIILSEPICYIIKQTYQSIEISQIKENTAENINPIDISSEGNISTVISPQELWNNLIEQGYELDKYLDSPEELATLVNVENVMQLPNTNNNDNNKMNVLGVGDEEKTTVKDESSVSTTLNGVIRFLRHDNKGKEYYLTYSSLEKFQEKITEYNDLGNEEARNYVMTHFTLQKKASTSTTTTNTTTSDILTDAGQKIVEAAKKEPGTGSRILLRMG